MQAAPSIALGPACQEKQKGGAGTVDVPLVVFPTSSVFDDGFA